MVNIIFFREDSSTMCSSITSSLNWHLIGHYSPLDEILKNLKLTGCHALRLLNQGLRCSVGDDSLIDPHSYEIC